MTDTLTELDPEQLRRELIRLFAEPKSLHHIVAAGLDGVRRQLAQLSEAIGTAENGADQVVDTVAKLCNLVRQEQRKHAGAVAQAKKEHARAERLAAEVEQLHAELAGHQGAAQRDHADWARAAVAKIHAYFGITPGLLGAYGEGGRKAAELIAPPEVPTEIGGSPVVEAPIPPCFCGHPQPDHDLVPSQPGILAPADTWVCFGCTNNGLSLMGIHSYKPKPDLPLLPQQREPVGGDRVRVVVEGDFVIDPRGFGEYTLAFRPGPNGTQIGYMGIPAHATITPLGTNPPAAADDAGHEVELLGHTVRISGFGAADVAAALRAGQDHDRTTASIRAFAAQLPCWCGHQVGFHVTDDSDNAVCRACIDDPSVPVHRALHVHTPEQP